MTKADIQTWQRTIGVLADGDFGPATLKASLALAPEAPTAPASSAGTYPLQKDMVAFYGPAGGVDCTAGVVALPMPFVIAWDKSQKVTTFRCHKKLAAAFTSIFRLAFDHYGADQMASLGLNIFGGCYNFRAMRGGTSLSIHSWGAAVDLDPENNQLAQHRDTARFAQPEYLPFWDIVEAHGMVSLGRARDYDWMHFQAARL